MRLHLATSDGSYQSLPVRTLGVEAHPHHLLSYAFAGRERGFAPYWEALWLMRLHLAIANNANRHVTEALARELPPHQLFSYAYAKYERQFGPVWEEVLRMHLHLAGIVTYQPEKLYPELEKRLDSFAYTAEAEKFMRGTPGGARLLIDSGAFTAHMSGKVFKPEAYAEWALDFKRRWEPKLASLHFMNLDVIGDQEASWRNQAIIERAGLQVIPIVTYGAGVDEFKRAVDGYPYVALGGMAGLLRDKRKLQAWLDQCFAVCAQRYKATGTMPRVHLLGLTQAWLTERYPLYSCDSSSWVSVLRYGGGKSIGVQGRFPKASAEPEINLYALRQEVKKYKAMEAKATATWQRRGIVFED